MPGKRNKTKTLMNKMLSPIERKLHISPLDGVAYSERRLLRSEKVRNNLLSTKADRREKAHVVWIRERAKKIKKSYATR